MEGCCWKHEECLKSYFEFIEFVVGVNKKDVELSPEHIRGLWDLFVSKATCAEESNFFYLHLMKSDEEGRR